MSFSKATALLAAGVLLFGTSLFSRDRDNPSWAFAPGGAAAANLSEVAKAAGEALHTRLSPRPPDGAEVSKAPAPSVAIPLQAPALSSAAADPGMASRPPRRMGSGTAAHRRCGARECGRAGATERSARAVSGRDAKSVQTLAEPIEFRLAVRGN